MTVMHELSVISSLFKIIEEVAEENHLTKITTVTLKLGKLQQIVPEMLTFAFETVSQGTKAEGARLNVEYAPITMRCNACQTQFIVEEHLYLCPACKQTDLTMLQGAEILLESLEGECV